MRIIILSLLFSAGLYANACAAQASGNWSATGTWTACGGTTPQPADTVALTPFNVTADVSATVTSIAFGATGTLLVNTGVTITSGNVTYAPTGNSSVDFTFDMAAGSNVYINGTYQQTASFAATRTWRAACSNASPCAIGGTTGIMQFTAPALFGSGSVNWAGVRGTKIGDASNFSLLASWSGGTAQNTTVWSWTDTTCDRCGYFQGTDGGTALSVTLRRVRFTNSATTALLGNNWSSKTGLVLDHVVFDKCFNANVTCSGSNGYAQAGWSMSDVFFEFNSFFDKTDLPTPPGPLFFVDHSPSSNTSGSFSNLGMTNGVYFLADHAKGNPEGYNLITPGGTWGPLVYQYDGYSHVDTGTVFYLKAASGNTTITKALVLPQVDYLPPVKVLEGAVTTNIGSLTDSTLWVFGGSLGAMYNQSHSLAAAWSQLSALKNNIGFGTVSNAGWIALDLDYNNLSAGCAQYTRIDAVSSTFTNFGGNYLWPALANTAEPGTCNTNSANGYGGKWSTTPPGTADVVANPRFLDYNRSVLDFPTRYLGMTGNAASGASWVSGNAYTAGEYVTSTTATVYNSMPILYRALVNHTGFADAKPGTPGPTKADARVASVTYNGTIATVTMAAGHPHNLVTGMTVYGFSFLQTNLVTVIDPLIFTMPNTTANGSTSAFDGFDLWRSFYEFGGLEVVRDNTFKGTTYTDWRIGCNTACSVIQAVLGWSRTGSGSTNLAFWGVGAVTITRWASPGGIGQGGAAY